MGDHYLNIKIIDKQKDLIDEVINLLNEKERDFSSKIVVFPGRRPSYFLRKKIAEKYKYSYIPPEIFSMDDFIDYLYEDKLGIYKRKIDAIEGVAIIYEILRQYNTEGLSLRKNLSVDLFFPLGIRLYRLFEELTIEMVPSDSLKSISDLLEDALKDIFSINQGITACLGELLTTFRKELFRLNLSTRSIRYQTVAEGFSEIGKLKDIIYAGFFAMTKAERQIIKETLKKENNIFLAQEGPYIYEKIKGLNESIQERAFCIKLPEKLFIYESPNSHSQVFACNRILKENNFDLNEKTCIVVPNPETLLPLGHFLLSSLQDTDYNISLGYPLIRTPIFGFLSLLMQILISKDGDAFFIPDYLNFILHPYTKNIKWQNSSETTRVFVHNLQEKLNSTYMQIDQIEGILDPQDRLHLRYIHEKTIKPFLDIFSIQDFILKVIDLLRFISENTTAKNHVLFAPFVNHFCEVLKKVLNTSLSALSFQNIGSYFNLLKHLIKTGTVNFPGTPLKGLQVLGFLETRNLTFKRLFIFDAIEGIIPQTQDDDSLFPHNIRAKLGLSTYQDKEKIGEYYFFTLLSKAEEAHIFYSEGDNNLRSRFIEKIIWEKQKESKCLEEKGMVRKISSKIILNEKQLRPIEKTEEMIEYLRNFEYSPSSIDRYLRCPHAFYYGDVLRLKEKKEISDDIQRDQVGEIVHEGLKIFFDPYQNKRLLIKGDYEDRIDGIVKRLSEDSFGKPLRGKHYLIYYQIKRHLVDFITFEKDRSEKEDIIIKGIEIKKSCIWKGFRLKGRIDRIDKIDNNYLIIDYKTGSSGSKKIRFDKIIIEDKKSWKKSIPSLQLPLYIILFLDGKDIDLSRLNACYIDLSLSNFNEKDRVLNYLFTEEKEKVYLEKLYGVIANILEEITDINTPFIANKDNSNCQYCEFKGLCGIN